MVDELRPNSAAEKEKAEGSREKVNPRGSREEAGGITNRPLDEEIRTQKEVPPRGMTKEEAEGPDAEDSDLRTTM